MTVEALFVGESLTFRHRRDKTSPIDLNNSDVLLKIPSTTTIFVFFCKISSIFHLSKLQRTRGENNGCRTAFIHCAI
jgi:hypothetical protein